VKVQQLSYEKIVKTVTVEEDEIVQDSSKKIIAPSLQKVTLKPALVSWGGGLDCCLSLWKATNEGFNVCYLYTAIPAEYGRVSIYGLKADVIALQAESMGATSILRKVNEENYQQCLLESLEELKKKGVEGMIFGDIDLQDGIEMQELREWGQRLCRVAGMQAHYPLWRADQRVLLREFVSLGFKAVVVAVNSKFFGPETLGRPVDESWIKELDKLGNVTYCGSEGEYYTMAYDGPLFKKKMMVSQGRKFRRDNYWLLDICV
jgi:diphthine-ammonia ligase